MSLDIIRLTQQLIQCSSVTPLEAGALTLIESYLKPLGFTCHRLVFENVENLYARRGETAPHFCFAGHVDVVPPGDEQSWTCPPFEGQIKDDFVYGRGAVDMKGALAAFIGAVSELSNLSKGSISLLITADEEGLALNGTQKVIEWLQARSETIDHCLVGEPSSQHTVGDTIKTGRLGSLNTTLTFHGKQGHVAYPNLADNPVPRLLETLWHLNKGPMEEASPYFAPTNSEITTIDIGNPTVNVIPAIATAGLNTRFNDCQTGETLKKWITEICDTYAGPYEIAFQLSGEADICQDQDFFNLVKKAIVSETSQEPLASTQGGTSDARFIRHIAPVLELGLISATMHQVNERVSIADLFLLKNIYLKILKEYLK